MNTAKKNNTGKHPSSMFPSAVINNDLKKYQEDPVILKKVEKGKALLEKLKLV
jgi:hypothetical protein